MNQDTSSSPAPGELLSQMWATRPQRRPEEGPVAGVCAGVAHRYGVDPLLVRVAFGVSTVLGGAGVPVYLAGWLLLPRAGDVTSAGEALLGRGASSVSRRTAIVLTVLLVITGANLLDTDTFGVGVLSSGLVGLVLLGTGLVLLHRRRPFAPEQARPTSTPVSLVKHPTRPPAWDPLGAAPFAWHLPEPAAGPPPRGPRSRHTPLTLGLALLAVAVALAVRVLTGSEWLSSGRIGAVALAVVGLGLVVGAYRRRGWGLLAAAAPLAGFVVIATLAGTVDSGSRDAETVRVTTQAQLLAGYETGLGDLELDLRGLALSEDRAVTVDAGIGSVTVLLPADLDVVVDCEAGLGTTDCVPSSPDPGSDGPVLTLAVDGGIGDVAVRRG